MEKNELPAQLAVLAMDCPFLITEQALRYFHYYCILMQWQARLRSKAFWSCY